MFSFLLILTFVISTTLCCAPSGFNPALLRGCSVFFTKLDHGPFLLSPDTHEILHANTYKAHVYVDTNQTVIFSCPGGSVLLNGQKLGTTEEVTCLRGGRWTMNGETVHFSDIACSKDPVPTTRYTGKSCEPGGKEVEVGFSVTNDVFVRQILVCFDEQQQKPLYATYQLDKSATIRDEAVIEESTIVDDSVGKFGIDVNDLYDEEALRAVVNSRVGLPSNATKYINNDHSLVRGYLAPKRDFVYASEQRATLYFANSVPLWTNIDHTISEVAEKWVKNLAEVLAFDVTVYAGTYGVVTLPHEETGDDVPLYLYNGTQIPVPELYWKVFYYPKKEFGLALVSVNSPNVNGSAICNDISRTLNIPIEQVRDFPTLMPLSNFTKNIGYSYACTVDDFRKGVPYLPQFKINGTFLQRDMEPDQDSMYKGDLDSIEY